MAVVVAVDRPRVAVVRLQATPALKWREVVVWAEVFNSSSLAQTKMDKDINNSDNRDRRMVFGGTPL